MTLSTILENLKNLKKDNKININKLQLKKPDFYKNINSSSLLIKQLDFSKDIKENN